MPHNYHMGHETTSGFLEHVCCNQKQKNTTTEEDAQTSGATTHGSSQLARSGGRGSEGPEGGRPRRTRLFASVTPEQARA